MIDTVLFDLDGTALDSEPDFTRILNRRLAQLERPAIDRDVVMTTVSNGARALLTLICAEDAPAFDDELERFLDAYEAQIRVSEARLFPGMASLLGTLEARGIGWGIVTNKSSRFTLPLLAAHPPLDTGRVTVCADEVPRRKPAPDTLLLACEKLQCQPEQCLYVGDHPRDIEAGREAGMPTVAAAWGYLPGAPGIDAWRADFIARRPGDIESLAVNFKG